MCRLPILDQLIENSKKMNIHLIFYSQDRMQVRNLLNALQGLEGKFGKASQVRFSATAVSDKGNKHLALTSDFGSWIDSWLMQQHPTRSLYLVAQVSMLP